MPVTCKSQRNSIFVTGVDQPFLVTPLGIPFKPISLITPRSVHGVVGAAVHSRHLAPSGECSSGWRKQQQQQQEEEQEEDEEEEW